MREPGSFREGCQYLLIYFNLRIHLNYYFGLMFNDQTHFKFDVPEN